jgi:hypothetical protein
MAAVMTPAMQLAAALKAKRGRKYRNEPVEVDGIQFASKREARRCAELLLMERAGQIRDLRFHPSFPLDVNGHPVCRYVGDAGYTITATGVRVVEDTKSPATRVNPVFRLKAKLFRAIHGFEITEV